MADHLSLAREHLVRAKRKGSLGAQWESNWRAFEQSLWHRYGKVEEGQLPQLIKHWSHDLDHLSQTECREFAHGEDLKKLTHVLPAVERIGKRDPAEAGPGRAAAAALRKAIRQDVSQMIVSEALQVCRVIRNEIVHGLKLSSMVPDKEVMLGSLPVIQLAAELAVRLGDRKQ